MLCYRVEIPDGAKVVGTTAAGDRAAVLPGEYLVHALRPKLPSAHAVFRFVGADALGRDVHVPLESFAAFLPGQTGSKRRPRPIAKRSTRMRPTSWWSTGWPATPQSSGLAFADSRWR